MLTSVGDYVNLLGLFYSYFGALEIFIDEHISPGYLPDIHERRKTDLISRDLLCLGTGVPQKLTPDFIPDIQNRYQAFGALYVIEGSSLGGIHIAKMIHKKLPEVSNAFLFFEGYGEQTITMWKRFKSGLDNLSGDRDELHAVISGAQNTFLKFAEWIHLNIK